MDKKSLKLNKETIRNLSDDELSKIDGAGGRIATYADTDTNAFQTDCPKVRCCEQTVSNC